MTPPKSRARSGLCNVGVATDDPSLPVAGTGKLAVVRKSKRGKWRAAVLIAVHGLVAVHITHYLIAGRSLSPVEPSEAMYTLELGYLNCGFIFFAVALAGTLVFGRFFCGWGCHLVALQDLCGWIMKKLGVRPRPFRSRLLAFGPLAMALYMFVWPTFARVVLDDGRGFPGLSNHLMTSALWATFPGPIFAVLTFASCGFAAVYFLGAKGFCTYGCPYGAFFGGLDYASPGRIVVNDDCEQCGHCTATCTSNVRVHEEVRLYGMVVDTGCMKCTDCVSVCPKGALRFTFAPPPLLRKPPKTSRARKFDLSLPEELLVATVGLASTLTFRDLYNGPPLLMSVGLGAVTAFVALKLWHLAKRARVGIQNLDLKANGRLTRTGWTFAIITVLWLAFTSHSAFAQWHRAWGRHYLNQTEVSREDGLSGAFKTMHYSARHDRALAEAFRHFSLADRWGLAGVVEVKLGLAWCELLRGDASRAAGLAGEAVALAPDQPELHRNLTDLERAAAPTFEKKFERATMLAASGQLDAAALELQECVSLAPDSAPAHFNLGGVLRRLGRNDAAIEELQTARILAPEDADVSIELGLAYQAAGETGKALQAFKRAMELSPDSPESKLHLPGLIRELEAAPPAAPQR